MKENHVSINQESGSISFVDQPCDGDIHDFSVTIRRNPDSDFLFASVENDKPIVVGDHNSLKKLAADLLEKVEDLSMDVIRNQTDGSMNWPNVIDRHRIECEELARLINRAKDMLKS